MNKLVALILFALSAVAYAGTKGEYHGVNGVKDHDNSETHIDDYVSLNERRYSRVLEGYRIKLQQFKESYLGRLEAVNLNKQLVAKSVVRAYNHWNPMLVLSDFVRQCVLSYRDRIESLEVTENAITKCHEDYSKQLNSLLSAAIATTNELFITIENYKAGVGYCGTNFGKLNAKYTPCVTDLTDKTNQLVKISGKNFRAQLEAAECTAKANVKSAIYCSYDVHVRTKTLIAEVEVLVEGCLLGEDECKPCADNTCSHSIDVSGQVNNETIYNPFYERSDNVKCIMLSAEYKV